MEKFKGDATKIDLDRNSGKLWQPRGGCFQISISICPRRCFTDSSRDNDTTTINDSSRVVSRWTPDIFDAKPPWNTPSNIYIVIHTVTSYLSLSKPINERYFPGRKWIDHQDEVTGSIEPSIFYFGVKVNDIQTWIK